MPDPTPLRPDATSIAATPVAATPVAAPAIFKVELDERCVTFPDGKQLQHLLVGVAAENRITIDAVYSFNRTHQDPQLASFSLAEGRDFARELVNAVYTARTGFVLTDTLKVAITVVANGYVIDITRADERREILLSTGVIWRVIKAFMMAVDSASPVVTN